MHKLRITPAAAADLASIQRYIAVELRNPEAADRMVRQITGQLRILTQHNLAGVSVQARTGYPTDLRMLVCRSHLAFYRVEPDGSVSVARILNARQDAMQLLFGGSLD